MSKIEPDTKPCPFCAETIKAAATVCRFCGRDMPVVVKEASPVLNVAVVITTVLFFLLFAICILLMAGYGGRFFPALR